MIIDFSRSMYWKDEHRKTTLRCAATFTTHSTTPTLWWTL
jgi:hypothetical protein